MKNQQIEKLNQILLSCGYHPEQIKQIITEALESAPVTTDSSREQWIIEALESYVEFATKCKMTKKSSTN